VRLPWIEPATGGRLTHHDGVARLASGRVALLGERHDRAEDHRWQALTLAGLAALRADVVVGFEMFPRRAQPALDAWGDGRLDAAGLLEASRWSEVWGFEPGLYLPLFELCRDLGLPMRAINIDRPLVTAIGRDGWDALPGHERDWLSPARPASGAYRRYLFEITGGVRPGRAAQSPADPAFDRFVRAQQAWDRAFACGLAAVLEHAPAALAVGIIGRGHLEYGFGVADQLDDLGIAPVLTALPDGPVEGIAELVFDPEAH